MPNAAASNALSQMLERRIAAGTDWSEIACELLEAAGHEGSILRVEPSKPGLNLRMVQDGYEEEFLHHEVYSDGKFVFDPRLSASPVPIDAWEQAIRAANPGATITGN